MHTQCFPPFFLYFLFINSFFPDPSPICSTLLKPFSFPKLSIQFCTSIYLQTSFDAIFYKISSVLPELLLCCWAWWRVKKCRAIIFRLSYWRLLRPRRRVPCLLIQRYAAHTATYNYYFYYFTRVYVYGARLIIYRSRILRFICVIINVPSLNIW